MSSTFLSQYNINLLKEALQNRLGKNINFESILMKKIEDVKKEIRNPPPKHIPLNNYILSLNKKVIFLVLNDSKIPGLMRKNEASSHIFDTNKQLYLNNNTNVMDRPQLQPSLKKNIQLDERFNRIKESRDSMFPKKQEVDFADKPVNNQVPTDKLFKNMLEQRESNFNSEQNRFGSFDEAQKRMNSQTESMAEQYVQTVTDNKNLPVHQPQSPGIDPEPDHKPNSFGHKNNPHPDTLFRSGTSLTQPQNNPPPNALFQQQQPIQNNPPPNTLFQQHQQPMQNNPTPNTLSQQHQHQQPIQNNPPPNTLFQQHQQPMQNNPTPNTLSQQHQHQQPIQNNPPPHTLFQQQQPMVQQQPVQNNPPPQTLFQQSQSQQQPQPQQQRQTLFTSSTNNNNPPPHTLFQQRESQQHESQQRESQQRKSQQRESQQHESQQRESQQRESQQHESQQSKSQPQQHPQPQQNNPPPDMLFQQQPNFHTGSMFAPEQDDEMMDIHDQENMNYGPVTQAPEQLLKRVDHYIDIDSRMDRDLSLYPDPNNFQIEFAKRDTESVERYVDKHGNVLYEHKVVEQNNKSSNIQPVYINILDIECKSVTVPVQQYGEYGGVSLDDEPYILLNIEEISGPYESSNKHVNDAFAKLIPNKVGNKFAELKPSGEHEIHQYESGELGVIDKLTLKLETKNGTKYTVGNDKTHIKSLFNSDGMVSFTLHDNVKHNINTGDLLYFYDRSPSFSDIIHFKESVSIKKIEKCTDIGYNFVQDIIDLKSNINKDELFDNILTDKREYISISFNVTNDENETTFVNVRDVFEKAFENNEIRRIGDYEILSKSDHYLYTVSEYNSKITNNLSKIVGFNREGIIIEKPKQFPQNKKKVSRLGFAKCNKGVQNNDANSLFFQGGHRVTNIDNGIYSVNVPFVDSFEDGEVFFIQHKMQINYTFKISCITRR